VRNIKRKISEYSKRFQFTQGMALGLTVSSFLAYGVVNITSFNPGTPISSAVVNSNFQELKDAVEKLQAKKIATLPNPFNVTCVSTPSGPSYPGDYADVSFDVEDGVTGAVSHETSITISVAGFYEVFYELPNGVSVPVSRYMNLNGIPRSIEEDGGFIKRFEINDTLSLQAGCSNTYGPTGILNQDGVVFIKKL
jgi:hypothetical protein